MSLKRTASVFRLKIGGKNLATDDYAANLCKYFDSAKACSTLTLGDLTNVLTGLKGKLTSICISKNIYIY